MRRHLTAALCALAGQAGAGGLDLTGQPVSFLFERGSVMEASFGLAAPHISGNDAAFLGGSPTGNIARPFALPSISFKKDLTDRVSLGLIWEKPFGSAVAFGPSSLAFGGTTASAKTATLTALGRYRLSERIAVHGGVRLQQAEASFRLTGSLYGAISGYGANLAPDTSAGYVVGASYEIPEYFLRVAVTYSSAIEHTFSTVETLGPAVVGIAPTTATTPQSVNLEFTTGIAPATFLFGGARWVEWSALRFDPAFLAGFSPDGLVNFNDTTTYSLGVGRQFSEQWVGLLSVIHEPGTSPFTTPLTPTDGLSALSAGLVYTAGATSVLTTVTATKLGDATPFVTGIGTVAAYSGNTTLGVGVKMVHRF